MRYQHSRHGETWLVLALLACLGSLIATSTWAAPPTIAAGECTYLVGAPPGAPLAPTEERDNGTRVIDVCDAPTSHVAVSASIPNAVEVAASALSGRRQCDMVAWTGHAFTVAGSGPPVAGHATIEGALQGQIQGSFGGVTQEDRVEVRVEIVELLPELSKEAIVASELVFESKTLGDAPRNYDLSFGRRLDARFTPGRSYVVRLSLNIRVGIFFDFDFGSPGSGRHARYDSIQVCLDPPDDLAALRAEVARANAGIDDLRVGQQDLARDVTDIRGLLDVMDAKLDELLAASRATNDQSLEWQLLQRDCTPSIWLPEASGGRMAGARTLVERRLAAIEALPGRARETQQARRKLAGADEALVDGDNRRACGLLAEALHSVSASLGSGR